MTVARLVVLTSSLLISGCVCLHCYNCESDGPAECSEVRECFPANSNYLQQFKEMFLPDVMVDLSKPPQPACYTTVITKDGRQMTTRGCSVFGMQHTCAFFKKTYESAGQGMVACTPCASDFCNEESQPGAPKQPASEQPIQFPGKKRPDTVLSTSTESNIAGVSAGGHEGVTPSPSVSKTEAMSAASSVHHVLSVLVVIALAVTSM